MDVEMKNGGGQAAEEWEEKKNQENLGSKKVLS